MRTGRLGPILSCHLPQVPSSVAVLPQLRGRAAGCPPTVGGALALRAGPRLATLGAEALGGSTLSLGRRRRPRRALPSPLGTAPHPAPRQEPSRGCSPCAAAAVLGVQGVSRLAGRRLIQPLPGWPRALKASRNVLATAPARSGGWHGRLAESPTL